VKVAGRLPPRTRPGRVHTAKYQLVRAYHLGAGLTLLVKWGKFAEEKIIFKDTWLAGTQKCMNRYPK